MLVSLLVAILIVILLLYIVQIFPLDNRIALALQVAIIIIAVIYLLGPSGSGQAAQSPHHRAVQAG
jgi:hypothetical protein